MSGVEPLIIANFAGQTAGTIAGTQGAIEQAEDAERTAKINSFLTIRESKEAARRLRRSQARERGEVITSIAASGLALSGSMSDALEDIFVEQELEAETILQRGRLSALGFQQEASAARAEKTNIEREGVFTLAKQGISFAGKNLLVGQNNSSAPSITNPSSRTGTPLNAGSSVRGIA